MCLLRRSKSTQALAFCCLTRGQREVKCVCTHLVLISFFPSPVGGKEAASSSLRWPVSVSRRKATSLPRRKGCQRSPARGCRLFTCCNMHLEPKQVKKIKTVFVQQLLSFICPVLPSLALTLSLPSVCFQLVFASHFSALPLSVIFRRRALTRVEFLLASLHLTAHRMQRGGMKGLRTGRRRNEVSEHR